MTSKKRKITNNEKYFKKRNATKPPFHFIAPCYYKLIECLDLKSVANLEISLVKRLISDSYIDNTNYRKIMFSYACNESFIKWILNRKLYIKHIIIDGSYFNDIILIQKYINYNCKFVETLRIISLDYLTDGIILKIISNCLYINSIYINDCNMISDHFISSLLLLKPHLLSLNIIHCQKVTSNIVKLIEKFRDLRKITLNNNIVTNEIDYNKISSLPKLRRFNLIENILDICNNNDDNNYDNNNDNNDEISNSYDSYSIDSVNTYSSKSDTDTNSESNILSDNDDDDDDSNLDSNESLTSLNTIDSDLSCPLLVYN